MTRKAYVVPTTHWDREWVQTQIQYQIRLVDLIDKLMKILEQDPEYICFLLDGQTAPLEDYLEIKPRQRDRLAELCASGRIIVGPWYVLADQFLEDGESTIRNLMIGRRQSRKLGAKPMNVCYVPDSFGSVDSLPLIAAGFDIPYVLFGRGRSAAIPSGESYFIWDGSDGSRVLAANLGYANALAMSYPDIWTDIQRAHPDPDHVVDLIPPELANDPQAERGIPAYLAVGIDHLEPRASLPSIVKHINAGIEEVDLVFGSPEDFFRDMSEHCASHLPVIRGEMRGPDVKCFNGCLSSHMDLKQQNFKSQRWLARYCEPLSTLACEAGQPYPTAFLDHLWRLLLVNHAHDSICGCSLDSVHDDMRNRYARIEQAATILCERAADKVAATMCLQHERTDAIPLVVFNTLGHPRSDMVQQWVRITSRFAHSSYHIMSDVGDLIPGVVDLQALKRKDLESVYMSVSQLGTVLSKTPSKEHPDDDVFTVLDVKFVASDIPAMGARLARSGFFPARQQRVSRPMWSLLIGACGMDSVRLSSTPMGRSICSTVHLGNGFRRCTHLRIPKTSVMPMDINTTTAQTCVAPADFQHLSNRPRSYRTASPTASLTSCRCLSGHRPRVAIGKPTPERSAASSRCEP